MSDKQTISEISIDTQLIIASMEKMQIGETISYEKLTELIGRDIRGVAKGCARTARKRLLADKKMYFECVKNVGYRRCNDREKVAGGGGFIRKARRACRRGILVTVAVDDYSGLPKEDQIKHNAQLSLLGTLRAISTPKKQEAIAAAVEQKQAKLSLSATLTAVKDYEKATGQA